MYAAVAAAVLRAAGVQWLGWPRMLAQAELAMSDSAGAALLCLASPDGFLQLTPRQPAGWIAG